MKIFSHTMRAGEMGIQWFPFSRLKGNSVLNIHVLLCRDGRYDPQRREMYARRSQMKRNNKFQKLSLWGALGGLALLGNTIAWRSEERRVGKECRGRSEAGRWGK